jgi:hypothetical protein
MVQGNPVEPKSKCAAVPLLGGVTSALQKAFTFPLGVQTICVLAPVASPKLPFPSEREQPPGKIDGFALAMEPPNVIPATTKASPSSFFIVSSSFYVSHHAPTLTPSVVKGDATLTLLDLAALGKRCKVE